MTESELILQEIAVKDAAIKALRDLLMEFAHTADQRERLNKITDTLQSINDRC
jgi:hypothetical protein